MNSTKEHIVEGIRHVHKSLRRKYRAEQDFDKVWEEHCKNEEALSNYARSMVDLATEIWDDDCDGLHRIEWCVDICLEYFHGEGLSKLLAKDNRRVSHYLESPDDFHCGPNPYKKSSFRTKDTYLSIDVSDKLDLLDVGSCYDPFRKFKKFRTVALDLKPACKTVYQCDFLKSEVEPSSNEEYEPPPLKSLGTTHLVALRATYFNVVVFSLLLTYLPSPSVRWQMCEKAHKVLKPNGLLLIITPDSSHQNKNAALMKCWKLAIEGIGFQRFRYCKDRHLHLMAYRKVPQDYLWDRKQSEYWERKVPHELNIPQDFQESSDDEEEERLEDDSQRQEFVNECLTQLPGFESS